MKIKSLKISNLRNVEIFEGDFGDWNVVGGDNGAGKSTIIDAIFFAIVGKTYTKSDPFRLVQNGKDKAVITLTLGDNKKELVITRQFTAPTEKTPEGNDSLRIEESNGSKLSQKDLTAFLSSFTIDPLYISRLKPKEQIEAIKEIAGVDTSEVEKQALEIYDARTIENRELQRLEGALSEYAGVEEVEEVSISELLKIEEEVRNHNATIDDTVKGIEDTKRELQEDEDEIKQLEEKIKTLKWDITAKKGTISNYEKDLKELGEKKDGLAIREKIENAESINKQADKYKKKQEIFKQKTAQFEKWEKLDKDYKAKLEEREKIIKESKIPDFVTFNKDEGVLINNIPFNQLNTAEQIKVSINLASILSPELRVLHIKDGALLDKNSLETIKEVIKDKDYQILIERVGEEEVDTIIMREGVKIK